MKEKIERCAFTDFMAEDGGSLHLKELILRGYSLLPLAHEGILVLGKKMKKMKGGDVKNGISWNRCRRARPDW